MKHATSKRTMPLCLALLVSALLFAQSALQTKETEPVQVPVITTDAMEPSKKNIDGSQLEAVQAEVYRQLECINMTLDTIGQNNATKSKKDKSSHLKANVQILRNEIDQIQRMTSLHTTIEQAYHLALLNQELIYCLNAAVKNDLNHIPRPNVERLAKRSLALQDITLDKINAILKKNAQALVKLAKDSEQIGLNKLNKTYRSVRNFSKTYKIPQITEHVAVYSALVLWWVYVTSEAKLPKFLVPVKKWIGDTPKSSTNQIEVDTLLVYEDTTKAPAYTKDGKKITFYKNVKKAESAADVKSVSAQLKDAETKDPVAYKEVAGKIQSGEAVLELDPDHTTWAHGKKSYSNPSTAHDHKPINAFNDMFKALVAIDNDTSVFKFSTGMLFAAYIKRDIEKLLEVWERKKQKIDDVLFGTAKQNNYDDMTLRTERFKDIVGREEVKAEFARVIEYIVNPDRYERAGIKVERGYLLAGEPQTGKTLMAKALAGEISAALEKAGKKQKVRLFEISTDNLAKKGIHYYMSLARTQAPCILFLDELDLLRLQRDGDTSRLSEFLTSMSGSLNSNEKDHVIILAATNKPENVDFALRQHGRFGKMFWFDKPTFKHRAEFFVKECEKRCMNIMAFDFMELARQTEGCSFGTLDIVVKKALMQAKLELAPVAQIHFEKAIDSEVRKLIPHGYLVPAEKELIVAIRQASKALTSLLLNPAKSLCSVTILPITQDLEEEHVTQQYNIAGMKGKEQRAVRYGGIFAYHLYDALDIQTQEELVKQCKIYLASNIGQKAFGLTSCAFEKNDKQEAFKFAKQIVLEGLDTKEMAKAIREEKLTVAYRLLEMYEKEVEKLLEDHKEELGKIVAQLQKRKTLSVGEIYEILNWDKAKLPTVALA